MSAEPTFQQWRETGRHFEHRGQRIFYQLGGRQGTGPTLLLIHGFPTASWDWHHQWPALCERFARVLAPDMIGFGYSAKPRDYPYSILDQADLHEALLRQHDVIQYHILAHDYGDTVAQELLARELERRASDITRPRLRSVCFLNGGLFPETHRARLVQKLLASPLGPLLSRLLNERSFRKSFSAIFGPKTQPTAQALAEFWELVSLNDGVRIFHKLIGYMAERRQHRSRWVGALQSATLPLRVIDGLDDPVSGAHMVARYRELVPNPDVVELPGIGHYPQVEAPDAVLKAFLAFHR
jgi:pimeloyl-ACP methyl ester carboxylesterase